MMWQCEKRPPRPGFETTTPCGIPCMGIPITKGQVALVDFQDYPAINRYLWVANFNNGIWYAIRKDHGQDIKMHRELMGYPAALIDHRNGNGLDNRRANLRIADKSKNSANQRIKPSRGFKGVYFDTWGSRWRAEIICHGFKFRLGSFKNKEDAIMAYDWAATVLFGEFARVNHEH